MEAKTDNLFKVLTAQPVVPVLIVESVEHAVPLARALVEGGLKALEITLRTDAALDVIKAMSDEIEDAVIGAGTILSAKDYEAAEKAGAKFIVSPGINGDILDAADDSDIPLLPGTATASEVLSLREEGYRVMKFFPAEQAGGAPYLKALSSPLSDIKFCPTGGISLQNAPDYLKLPNVLCVGGSWVAPKDLVAKGDWDGIKKLAEDACATLKF
ncbi:2-dehydro-3-deoxy-phosphogluconate aldolase [Martelella mediterranea]|uniref:2-dehydro-3-deoxy-phosphogluconate aldolase n=1 Tax=Martelella mediterranea TaxID=293089 RepID=A0A4R3NLM9_9HYPH|nr:2-dehydro-3-deoxy-phosphogluconate aldolase [Martelella mediterranea]TCT35294.1 2-keto-3-deoxy-phosphogluconate aldolase [Martelella mediterranea]